eukprot:GHVU01149061.1.p1 GENE.GHVU01149061.1~~GHVU01149061.1.p1  ORF type:complete len:110 (-),score=1.03 GHVU01149061.1:21-350(-)
MPLNNHHSRHGYGKDRINLRQRLPHRQVELVASTPYSYHFVGTPLFGQVSPLSAVVINGPMFGIAEGSVLLETPSSPSQSDSHSSYSVMTFSTISLSTRNVPLILVFLM